jgi:hypothetical protein
MALPALDGPYVASINVVSSNSTVFPLATRALYVGTTGNVVVHWAQANTNTFPVASGFEEVALIPNVPAGTVLHIRVDKVLTTTTANNIKALF